MIKCKCRIIFICAMVLLSLGMKDATADEYIKNIEIIDSSISIDHKHVPWVAYLNITLKNNGDRKVSNLTLKISYYGEGDYLIKKAVIKKALNDAIPQGEARKYKVHLKGNVVNARNEQYPYSQYDKIDNFDVEIVSAALT